MGPMHPSRWHFGQWHYIGDSASNFSSGLRGRGFESLDHGPFPLVVVLGVVAFNDVCEGFGGCCHDLYG